MSTISNLGERWVKWLLVLLVAVLMIWNTFQASKLTRGSKAPPQHANAVICTNCGWHGWRATLKLPQKCPKCHKMTVHFAGICPECGEWTLWDLAREEELYANPRLFMAKGPAYFFPKCRKCGTQTNATGENFSIPVQPKSNTEKPNKTDKGPQ